MTDLEQRVFTVLDRVRGKIPLHDVERLLIALRDAGVPPSPEVLRLITQSDPPGDGPEYTFPADLATFICDLLAGRELRSVICPWAGAGLLAIPVYQRLKPERFDVITTDQSQANVLRMLEGSAGINVHVAEPVEALDDWPIKYDAALSCPPFGYGHGRSIHLSIGTAVMNCRDNHGNLTILQACRRLNDHGIGVFIVPESFFFDRRENNVRNALGALGYEVTACIGLPAGTFRPTTMIATNLIVVQQAPKGTIFVGEYATDKRHQKVMLHNFRTRSAGKRFPLGCLIDSEEFTGFSPLASAERIRFLAQRMGLEEIDACRVFAEVNKSKSGKQFEPFGERPNCVYLPEMAATPAVTSQVQLPERLKSYFQLVVDPEVADAAYLAGYLNTPLGMMVRDSLRRGATIQRIGRDVLVHGSLYLPDLATQRKSAEAVARITLLLMFALPMIPRRGPGPSVPGFRWKPSVHWLCKAQ